LQARETTKTAMEHHQKQANGHICFFYTNIHQHLPQKNNTAYIND
jgi:hypothetical protein